MTSTTKSARSETRTTGQAPSVKLHEHPLFAGIKSGSTEAAERAIRQKALAETFSREMTRRGLSEAQVVDSTELPAGVVHACLTGTGELPPRYALLAIANKVGVDLDRAIKGVVSTSSASKHIVLEQRDPPVLTRRSDGLVEVTFLRPLILPSSVAAEIKKILAGGDESHDRS
ncbi:hypothetical protein [Belnapia moabensis]|uniref:hypothetical protein n=1 Tax=Belnapia moabensis TaxID=365533 RepID=UPI001B80536F|nr:hypothetical protein [Belnapia moabensis]